MYELLYQNKLIGNVCVKKIGLYYEIKCHFNENKNGRFSLIAVSNSKEVNLGECGYHNGQFGIFRRLPINAVGRNLVRFYVKKLEDNESYWSVCEGKSFPHIDKLDKAVLIIVKGEKRIKI